MTAQMSQYVKFRAFFTIIDLIIQRLLRRLEFYLIMSNFNVLRQLGGHFLNCLYKLKLNVLKCQIHTLIYKFYTIICNIHTLIGKFNTLICTFQTLKCIVNT